MACIISEQDSILTEYERQRLIVSIGYNIAISRKLSIEDDIEKLTSWLSEIGFAKDWTRWERCNRPIDEDSLVACFCFDT